MRQICINILNQIETSLSNNFSCLIDKINNFNLGCLNMKNNSKYHGRYTDDEFLNHLEYLESDYKYEFDSLQ